LTSDINDCLSQYANTDNGLAAAKRVSAAQPNIQPTHSFAAKLLQYAPAAEQQTAAVSKNQLNISTASSSDMNSSVGGGEIDGVFRGYRFQIIGFNETEGKGLAEVLRQKGARSVTLLESDLASYSSSSLSRKKEQVDYTLCPQTIPAPTSNNNPVTVFWMVSF
jgi:ribosomal protein S6E (S10)